MIRLDSVEGQASPHDERYLYVILQILNMPDESPKQGRNASCDALNLFTQKFLYDL